MILSHTEPLARHKSFLEFGRIVHGLLDGLLCHFWCHFLASLEFLAILWVHGQQHTGTEKIFRIRNEAVFYVLRSFGNFILVTGFLELEMGKKNSIIVSNQNSGIEI